jgi:hypothetical protein
MRTYLVACILLTLLTATAATCRIKSKPRGPFNPRPSIQELVA